MSRERKTLAGPEKLAILRRYLVDKVPISDLCDQYGLQPSQVYCWQAQLFEHGASVFERKPGRKASAETAKDRKIAQLETVVAQKRASRLDEHMNPTPEILTSEEMRHRYGHFYHATLTLTLDRSKVPVRFWPLLPYAEFWGQADDWARETLVKHAPQHVKQDLKEAVAAFDHDLDEWLAGPEADDRNPSEEYVAFSAMRMAAYYALFAARIERAAARRVPDVAAELAPVTGPAAPVPPRCPSWPGRRRCG